MPPPPVSPGGQPLADFGNRLLAYLIDAAILVGVTMIVALPAFLIFFFAVVQQTIEETGPDGTVPDANVGPILLGALALKRGCAARFVVVVQDQELPLNHQPARGCLLRAQKGRVTGDRVQL